MDRLTVYDPELGRYKANADKNRTLFIQEPGECINGIRTPGASWVVSNFVDKLAEYENNEESELNAIATKRETNQLLKPCPFCGGAAEIVDHGRITNRQRLPFFRIRCQECGVHRSKYSTTVSGARKAWNERF